MTLLHRYLLKAAAVTDDSALRRAMLQLSQQTKGTDESIHDNQDDEIPDPDLNNGLPVHNKQIKGVEELLLRKAMPEIEKPNPEMPEVFGKVNAPADAQIKMSMWGALAKRAMSIRERPVSTVKKGLSKISMMTHLRRVSMRKSK